MKQETKKTGKVIDAVQLSSTQKDNIHNAVTYELEIIKMENIYNKDRASLKKLLHENIALTMGATPTYKLWNYVHEVFRGEVCKATGMEFESFDKNIWSDITKNLENEFDLVKPKSPNVKSEQKSEQRKAIDALTDEQLKEQGKLVELAKREEKRLKNENTLLKKAQNAYVKDFTNRMHNIAKNEVELAMWIDTRLDKFRDDLKKQS